MIRGEDEEQDPNPGAQLARVLATSFLIFSTLTVVRIQQARYQRAARFKPYKKTQFPWEAAPFVKHGDSSDMLSATYINSQYTFAPTFHNTRGGGWAGISVVAESTPNSTFVIAPEILQDGNLRVFNFASFSSKQPSVADARNRVFPDVLAVTVDTRLFKTRNLPGCPSRPPGASAMNSESDLAAAVEVEQKDNVDSKHRRNGKASHDDDDDDDDDDKVVDYDYRGDSLLMNSTKSSHSKTEHPLSHCYIALQTVPKEFCTELYRKKAMLYRTVSKENVLDDDEEEGRPSEVGGKKRTLLKDTADGSDRRNLFSVVLPSDREALADSHSFDIGSGVGEEKGSGEYGRQAENLFKSSAISWTCSAGTMARQCVRVITGPSLPYLNDVYTITSLDEMERFKEMGSGAGGAGGGASFIWGDSNREANLTEVQEEVAQILQDSVVLGEGTEYAQQVEGNEKERDSVGGAKDKGKKKKKGNNGAARKVEELSSSSRKLADGKMELNVSDDDDDDDGGGGSEGNANVDDEEDRRLDEERRLVGAAGGSDDLPNNRLDDPGFGLHFCGNPVRHLVCVDSVGGRLFFVQPTVPSELDVFGEGNSEGKRGVMMEEKDNEPRKLVTMKHKQYNFAFDDDDDDEEGVHKNNEDENDEVFGDEDEDSNGLGSHAPHKEDNDDEERRRRRGEQSRQNGENDRRSWKFGGVGSENEMEGEKELQEMLASGLKNVDLVIRQLVGVEDFSRVDDEEDDVKGGLLRRLLGVDQDEGEEQRIGAAARNKSWSALRGLREGSGSRSVNMEEFMNDENVDVLDLEKDPRSRSKAPGSSSPNGDVDDDDDDEDEDDEDDDGDNDSEDAGDSVKERKAERYCVAQYFFDVYYADVSSCQPIPRPRHLKLGSRPPMNIKYDELTDSLVFFDIDRRSNLVLTVTHSDPVVLRFSIRLENLRSGWVLSSSFASEGTVLVLGDRAPYWGILHVIDLKRGKDHRIDISRFAAARRRQ